MEKINGSPRVQEFIKERAGRDSSVSREAVQSWESGVRTPPLPMIIELAEFFGVSVDYLIGRTKEGEFSLSKDELKKLEEVAKILTKIISQQKP